MKRINAYLVIIATGLIVLFSCEGCVKDASKRITNAGLDALEGVAEALQERGDSIGKKVFDASGKVLEGAGQSLGEQLDEHADDIGALAGRTIVQSIDGLEQGLSEGYYDEFISEKTLCDGVEMTLFGKIKNRNVVDAYFNFFEEGKYSIIFDFYSDDCKTVVLTKNANFTKTADYKERKRISFSFSTDEENLIDNAKCVRVTVKK